MNLQNKIMLAVTSGLLAGFGLGYLLASRDDSSDYLYEWSDVEDYGGEDLDDEYEVSIPDYDSHDDEQYGDEYEHAPVMKAEEAPYK